jgi:hypothetical protein
VEEEEMAMVVLAEQVDRVVVDHILMRLAVLARLDKEMLAVKAEQHLFRAVAGVVLVL